METYMDCYGTMFPDLDRLDLNKPSSGKAFEVLVESHGIGVSSRQVTVRPGGWDECTACENFRDCYDRAWPGRLWSLGVVLSPQPERL